MCPFVAPSFRGDAKHRTLMCNCTSEFTSSRCPGMTEYAV
jgi:hypothetical protein